MKRIRAIAELIALWFAIAIVGAITLLILLPVEPSSASQAGHVYSGKVRGTT